MIERGAGYSGLIWSAILAASQWMACPLAGSFPEPDEWPAFRRGDGLLARSAIRGSMEKPFIRWTQFVGNWETEVLVKPGNEQQRLDLPKEPSKETAGFREKNVVHSRSVNGDSRSASEMDTSTVVFADLFSEYAGLEKVEFESAFQKPTIRGQWQPCVGRCYARVEGLWTLVWQTEPIQMLFQPLPLVGDFDGDGLVEIAILPMKELLLLEARTGRIKDRRLFTDTRSYGYFGAHDLDGDGRKEFLVQADFSKHIDVLGFRDGRLDLFWQWNIETDISNPQRVLRVGPRPVADLDGDGLPEVLASVFNHMDDHRWRLRLMEGMTGRVKGELVGQYLCGVVDVDSDGVVELLTAEVSGAGIPEFGTLSIWSWKGGLPRRLWKKDNAAWQLEEQGMPLQAQSTATLGRFTAMHSGKQLVYRELEERKLGDERVTLVRAEWDGRTLRSRTRVSGWGLRATRLDSDGQFCLRAVHGAVGAASLRVEGGIGYLGETRSTRITPATVALIRERHEQAARCVVQGPAENVVIFEPQQIELNGVSSSGRVGRFKGRGQGASGPEGFGPVVADLAGNGRRQILRATEAPRGCARMVASDLNGNERWHHDWPEIPGGSPIWNVGGLIFWQAGHFTDLHRQDVLVTLRRSMMHSEETCLLSGVDGRELWRRSRQVASRGVGGTPFAIADFNGDGLSDAASFHPSLVYILDGRSGVDLVAREALWSEVPARPVYWGLPMAGDFLGQGFNSLFVAGRTMNGVLRRDSSLVWWDAMDSAPVGWPAVGHFIPSTGMQTVGYGFSDGIRCCESATGQVLWRLALPVEGAVAGCASGDVDGDGLDEALFSVGTRLVCVGAREEGSGRWVGNVEWVMEFPALLGPPSLGALSAGGVLTAVVAAADGWVYGVR